MAEECKDVPTERDVVENGCESAALKDGARSAERCPAKTVLQNGRWWRMDGSSDARVEHWCQPRQHVFAVLSCVHARTASVCLSVSLRELRIGTFRTAFHFGAVWRSSDCTCAALDCQTRAGGCLAWTASLSAILPHSPSRSPSPRVFRSVRIRHHRGSRCSRPHQLLHRRRPTTARSRA